MKKSLFLTVLTLLGLPAVQAQADDADVLVLTFEDADFKGDLENIAYQTDGMTAANYWTSLVDTPQYYGPLLYNETKQYQWFDQGNTNLKGWVNDSYGYMYWNGGSAISNYVASSYENKDYNQQLEAYNANPEGKGGVFGSANFAVVTGTDNSYGGQRAAFEFDGADGEPLYTYVNLGTYGLSNAINGGSMCTAVTDGQWMDVTANAFDAEGNPVGEQVKFRIVDGPSGITKEWTKWDLSALGKCRKVVFGFESNITNEYGITFPTYVLVDNFAVKKPELSAIQSVEAAPEAGADVIYTITGVRVSEMSTPGIYIVNGKKVLKR